jgi:hypothetical protein
VKQPHLEELFGELPIGSDEYRYHYLVNASTSVLPVKWVFSNSLRGRRVTVLQI